MMSSHKSTFVEKKLQGQYSERCEVGGLLLISDTKSTFMRKVRLALASNLADENDAQLQK